MKHNIHLPESSDFACVCAFIVLLIHPSDDAPLWVFELFGAFLVMALIITLMLRNHESKHKNKF